MRKPSWKQDTPRMQMATFYQAMWGQVNNLSEGITTPEKALPKLLILLDEVKDLLKEMPEGEWKE